MVPEALLFSLTRSVLSAFQAGRKAGSNALDRVDAQLTLCKTERELLNALADQIADLDNGTVIEVPTAWPAKAGEPAVYITKRETTTEADVTIGTLTAASDHALAIAGAGQAFVLSADDPLTAIARRQIQGDASYRAVDDAIAGVAELRP